MRLRSADTKLEVVPLGKTAPSHAFVSSVPGQAAPLVVFDLPKGVSGASRMRIAKQQMADRIGDAAETICLASVEKDPNWTRALHCSQEAIGQWLTQEPCSSPKCKAILPDYLTLPAGPNAIVVAQTGDRVQVRIGVHDGFGAPVLLAREMLGRALGGTTCTNAFLGNGVADAIKDALVSSGVNVVMADLDAAETYGLKRFAADELNADLRNAGGSVESGLSSNVGLWGAAALVAGLAFALWASAIFVETRKLQAATSEVREQMSQLLRQGLLPDGPILDVRQQVIRALQEAAEPDQKDATPLDLISRVTVALFGKGLEVQDLNYAAAQGVTLRIVASDFAAVDQIVKEMRVAGLEAKALGLRARGTSGVEARLEVNDLQEIEK